MHETIESFTYTCSLRRGSSITSKVTPQLEYSMDFILLPNIATSWFIPRIAADGTKDNSWPFGTGIPSIGFKNRRILRHDDTIHCHEATRDKINFM